MNLHDYFRVSLSVGSNSNCCVSIQDARMQGDFIDSAAVDQSVQYENFGHVQ